jgi:membrane protein
VRKGTRRRGKSSVASEAWQATKRIYAEFDKDRIPTVAGGITFFILLAIFPAIASIVSLYGMFAHRSTIARDIDLMSGFLPGGAISILNAELHRLIVQKASKLDFTFLVSSFVALWSASGGFKALIEGLNVAYEVPETRSFFRLSLNALIFTVAGVFMAVIAISVGLIIPTVTDQAPISHALTIFFQLLMWPVSLVLCAIVLSAIYHFGPDRPQHQWRWINRGGLIASGLWLIGTRCFSLYVQYFGSYDRIYGDLGAAVGFLTWVWISLVILLLGAEINCDLDNRRNGHLG